MRMTFASAALFALASAASAQDGGKLPWNHEPKAGLEEARKVEKPVLYLFATAKDDTKKLEEAMADATLKDLLAKFVFARSEIKKDSEDAKRFKVASSTQPVLFVLNPGAEKPEDAPLRKATGKKTAKELKSELEAALKKWGEVKAKETRTPGKDEGK